MIKRFFPALLAVLLLTGTAYAAEPELPDGVAITDITKYAETAEYALPQIYPTDIQTKTEDGVKLLLKIFEVGPEVSPAALIESGLMRNGVEYELRDILRKTFPDKQEKKTVSRSVTVSVDSDKREDILPLLPKSMDYSENGYTGQLLLDEASIGTAVENTEGYRYATTAFYKCSGGGSEPDGYAVTATYSGEVVKTVPGDAIYTLIYAVKLIAPIELPQSVNWTPVLFILGGVVVAGSGAIISLLIRGHRQNAMPVSANCAPEMLKKRMMKPKNLSDLLEDDDE